MRERNSVSDNGGELGALQDPLPELWCLSLGLQRVFELVATVVQCYRVERGRLVLLEAEREQADTAPGAPKRSL